MGGCEQKARYQTSNFRALMGLCSGMWSTEWHFCFRSLKKVNSSLFSCPDLNSGMSLCNSWQILHFPPIRGEWRLRNSEISQKRLIGTGSSAHQQQLSSKFPTQSRVFVSGEHPTFETDPQRGILPLGPDREPIWDQLWESLRDLLLGHSRPDYRRGPESGK